MYRMCPNFVPISSSVNVCECDPFVSALLVNVCVDSSSTCMYRACTSKCIMTLCVCVCVCVCCFQIDYTGIDASSPCYNCAQNYSWNSTSSCTCSVPFTLDQPFEVELGTCCVSNRLTVYTTNAYLILFNTRAVIKSCNLFLN